MLTGNILLISSSKQNLKKNIWDFVKGKPEKNETIYKTIKREVKEEININIDISCLQYCCSQNSKRKKIFLYYYYLDNDFSNFKENREIYKIKYFNIKNIPNISKNQRLLLTDILIKFNKY